MSSPAADAGAASLVDPELRAALSRAESHDFSDIVADRRRTAQRRAAAGPVVLPDDVSTSTRRVPGLLGEPDVEVVDYVPANRSPGGSSLVWLHGGGYVLGDAAQDGALLADLARECALVVTSVQYRLAPEHPYPAALHDGYAVLRSTVFDAARWGIDPASVVLGGVSAGAGLAAAIALLARDRGEVAPVRQVLVYPMLDDRTGAAPADAPPWELPVWSPDDNRYAWGAYLGGRSATDLGYAAPARVEQLSGVAPAAVFVGELDLFRYEVLAYADRLAAADVPVRCTVYPGAYHGFLAMAPTAAVTRRLREELVASLRSPLT